MYIIGDIGNTEIKICLISDKNKIKKKINFKTKYISRNYLNNKCKYIIRNKNKINNILFSSVVPKVYFIVKEYMEKKINIKCTELKQIDLSKYITVKVNKKQIGSDRLANALSTIDNKNNYIIVDLGTATTFDVVSKNIYLGGIIAPGILLSLNNLINKASLIPKINLSKIKNIIGRNTTSSVKSGFYWGYLGMISNIIKLIKAETRLKYKIIFTGGLSHLFYKSLSYKAKMDKDLTLKGLIKIKKLKYK